MEPRDSPSDTSPQGDVHLLPVRKLNEYAYCPRLFHLMHVEGRWMENHHTAEGSDAHRRLDRLDEVLPDPDKAEESSAEENADPEDTPPDIARSVSLGSDELGLLGKLDLVATDGSEAIPVDTKRGRPPDNEHRSWEPERVQLMAQGLLLREHGYVAERGVLYFAGAKTRVDVPFAEDLEARTLKLLRDARAAAHRTTLPDPLEDSPKCDGCSLSPICLPDETLTLREVPPKDAPDEGSNAVRRLYPARDDALPLYVQEQGATVGKKRSRLVVRKQGEELGVASLKDVSQLVLCGNISVTPQTIHLLCEAEVPIVHLSRGNWFYGITAGVTLRNAYDRAAQFDAAQDPVQTLKFAKKVVEAKGANQRTLLMRNARPRPDDALERMRTLLRKVSAAKDLPDLLGFEGALGSQYFAHFDRLLRPRDFSTGWDYRGRNRRPPKDPVNALLSFGYALLAKECTIALIAEGLDPWWGLFHQPRHGRPALALDLMEEFRALVVDSAVVTAVNTGMVTKRAFVRSKAGCVLTPSGRKAFIKAYEARMDQLVTHPHFDYRCSWRTLVRVQSRLLARWLRADIPEYTGMTTR